MHFFFISEPEIVENQNVKSWLEYEKQNKTYWNVKNVSKCWPYKYLGHQYGCKRRYKNEQKMMLLN